MLSKIACCTHFSQSQLRADFSISTTIDLLSSLSEIAAEIFLFQESALIAKQLCGITMNYSKGFLASERSVLYSGTLCSMNLRF